MLKILDKVFIVALISFLSLGFIIVFTQLLGLIIQNGELIIKVNDLLAEPAFILSAIAGVLGFLIPVIKNKSSNVLTEEELEEQLLEKQTKVNLS